MPMPPARSLDDELRPWQLTALALLALVLGALFQRMAEAPGGHPLPYIAAAALGGLVGAGELTQRYKDRPEAALATTPGVLYIGINALLSLIVLWLVRVRQIDVVLGVPGAGGAAPAPPAGAAAAQGGLGATPSEVLLAGIGSMALLRTSLFTLRVRNQDIPVGPAALLQILLAAADRACDRDRAGPRAREVRRIMHGVSFARAKTTLPLHCLASMQNVSAEERDALDQAIGSLASTTDLDDEVKAYNLGLLLVSLVGLAVLEDTVQALITLLAEPPPDQSSLLVLARQFAWADLTTLITLCVALDPAERAAPSPAQQAAWLEVPLEPARLVERVTVVLTRLRRYFGMGTLARACDIMLQGATDTGPLKAGALDKA
jgi:hypothetical protein